MSRFGSDLGSEIFFGFGSGFQSFLGLFQENMRFLGFFGFANFFWIRVGFGLQKKPLVGFLGTRPITTHASMPLIT